MKKAIIMVGLSLMSLSAFAGSKQVIGVATVCDCYERTIDGEHYLGKVGSKNAARTESAARLEAKKECSRRDKDPAFAAQIQNCVYSKAVQERVGNKIISRIERLANDEENSLHNDLLGTL